MAPQTFAQQPTAERTFYQHESGVSVTNARAIFQGKTYAMAQISSVHVGKVDPKRGGAIATLAIGILLLVMAAPAESGGLAVVGVILAIIGGLWLASLKVTYSVVLSSSSGETQALQSKDGPFIEGIVNGINEALVHRG